MNLGALLFSFRGRVNRSKYWAASLAYLVVTAAVYGIGIEVDAGLGYVTLSLIAYFILFISSLAIAAKRVHDRDKSAWWLLLFYVVPVVLAGIGLIVTVEIRDPTNVTIEVVCFLIALLIAVWTFVEVGCLPGTVGTNRYGPNPLMMD